MLTWSSRGDGDLCPTATNILFARYRHRRQAASLPRSPSLEGNDARRSFWLPLHWAMRTWQTLAGSLTRVCTLNAARDFLPATSKPPATSSSTPKLVDRRVVLTQFGLDDGVGLLAIGSTSSGRDALPESAGRRTAAPSQTERCLGPCRRASRYRPRPDVIASSIGNVSEFTDFALWAKSLNACS